MKNLGEQQNVFEILGSLRIVPSFQDSLGFLGGVQTLCSHFRGEWVNNKWRQKRTGEKGVPSCN